MIVIMGFFIFLLGVIGALPWAGELIVGFFMFLPLIAGAVMAFILIGTVVGFNLMFPAVAYDGSDCFDAMSRALSYVYARPWRMVIYTAITVIYGAICYTFIRFFAFLLLWVTHGSLLLGARFASWAVGLFGISTRVVEKLTVIWSGPTLANLVDPPDWAAATWPERIAAVPAYLFLLTVVLLVVSFVISFYFSANTIIYSLMRKKVYDTPLDDVYTPFEDVDAEQNAFESGTEEIDPEPEQDPETQPDSETE
jgi:hypothetical protein